MVVIRTNDGNLPIPTDRKLQQVDILFRGRGMAAEKLKVGLVQINNSFSGQNYLPLSVGLLQAYVQRHAQAPGRFEFLLPIYSRRPVKTMVEHLRGANVVAFSTYVWNINISLEVARIINQESPDTLVVFGGPQVPDRAEAFLRKYPYIDLVCHGEGEQVFLSILESSPFGNWADVPSISYVHEDGSFINHVRTARIKELVLVPSPLLKGVFDPLMEANPREEWLGLWETNRGCPFSCTFCDWGSAIASKVYTFDIERLAKEIDWFADHKIEFVFCCDANFGILPRDLDIAQHVAKVKRASGYPRAFSVQNTKNATERAYNVQKVLADAGLNKGVTISFQSVDPETLKSIKRQNISSESFHELQHRFTRDKVETYTDLILGLPGETYDSFADGVSYLIENGQHNRIQFNNLSILPNAEMGDPEYQKKYGMVTVESKIWNIHGSLEELDEEVSETQVLVIATSAMPKEDWLKTRVFCWVTGLLHFDKVLQVPLVLVHETCRISYRELIESFLKVDPVEFPVLAQIRNFFQDKARDIQNGGPEYCLSREWLNIGWPANEYILIQLCTAGNLSAFYAEAEMLLSNLLRGGSIDLPSVLLHDAVQLNHQLLKLPFQVEDLDFSASHNIWEFYQSVLVGEPLPLEKQQSTYHINCSKVTYSSWADWCREVIWYGNKRGAYLYGDALVHRQLAGHY